MIRKTILTLAALLAISALGTSPARADIDIDINLGFGGGYLGKVSCGTGARIVDRRFNRVVARDCRGSHYRVHGLPQWQMVSHHPEFADCAHRGHSPLVALGIGPIRQISSWPCSTRPSSLLPERRCPHQVRA